MQRALDQLFKDAVNRKPKRLSFDTTYSHGNIYDWLLKIILTDWTIIIPGSSCSEFALSNWPATGFTRNGVKQWWLEKKESSKTRWSYRWCLWTFSLLSQFINIAIKSELNYRAIFWRSRISMFDFNLLTSKEWSWSIRTTTCRRIDFRKLYQTGSSISTVLARILWKLV